MPMRKPERLLVLLWLWCSLYAGAAWGAALEVTQDERVNANTALRLCVTLPQASLIQAQSGDCLPDAGASQSPLNVSRGVDAQHAFWLQLNLHNSSNQPLERWLQVGHPRLEEVSLFLPDGTRLDAGISAPMAQRADVPRHYGVLPVTLPAQGSQTVWLRVYSRTLVDLGVTVWSPNAYRESMGLNHWSLTLALGSLMAALLYALASFVQTRELPYLFFFVAMAGEVALEAFRAGLLQRYGWPANMPMPVQLGAVASMVALLGFVAFFYTLVPGARRQRRVFPVYLALVALTVLAQLWSIFVNYQAAVMLWTQGVYVVLLLGIWIIWGAWRAGSRPAGSLLLGFGLMLVPETLRQASVMGLLPFLRVELVSGPWALVFVVPVLFAGLAQRSRELQARLLKADSENQAKMDFLAHMSHELRTPLDTILGNAQLLERPANQGLLQEGLGHIQHSGRHLLGMIDEVLDYSRGVAGRLVIQAEPVNWAAFMNAVKQSAYLLAERNGNTFLLNVQGLQVAGLRLDEERLRQVLDNLLANAARHTHNSWIALDCTIGQGSHTDETGQKTVRLDFVVSDGGEGIAPEDQQRIFLPFERGASQRRRTDRADKGAGMGLAIARQLVEAMGGRLTVKSTLGHGAQFAFWMVAGLLEKQEIPALRLQAHFDYRAYRGPRRSILVVDDQPESRRVLGQLLEGCGFTVVLVTSGANASRVLAQPSAIDLVLTDQFMDDGDGWAVLQAAARRDASMPVVLMSAAPGKRPVGFAPELDFAQQLLKPLDHADLLRRIGELLHLQWESPAPLPPASAPPSPGTAHIEPSPVPSAVPPESDLKVLMALVEAGQVSEILQWSDRLRAAQPEYARFAQEVYVAARFLDFPALRALATHGTAN
jgi:signal transduction histidine kinase/DNA-binding NarL/FixJ family response regulator